MAIKKCFVLATCAVFISTGAISATFSVDNVDDSGVGSLRQAIIDANLAAGADLIEFNIPSGSCSSAGVCFVVLMSDLPEITGEILIDGTTQPRYGTAPDNVCATEFAPSSMRVQISAPNGAFMLVLASTGASTIRGLSLSGGYPISARSAAVHHIACNHIGLNAEGDTGLPISGRGVTIEGSARGVIIGTNGDGVGDIGERNVIGVVAGFGVYINANSDNWVAGNYFGFGADGVTAVGSTANSIFMRQSSSGNLVGTNGDLQSDEIERNIIGSVGTGIWIASRSGDGDGNQVVGNWIGLDAAGEPAVNSAGISISGGGLDHLLQDNYIGSGNSSGIRIQDASTLAAFSNGNCLVDNNIGFLHAGSQPVVLEDNWWGASDGPSGVGAGSGDAVTETGDGVVDFTPWLTGVPESCLVPEPSLVSAQMAALGSLMWLARRRKVQNGRSSILVE
jgi:hypothetical protein